MDSQILVTVPVSAVAPVVTETTGLAGSTAVNDVIGTITPTFWPVLALIGWVLLLIAAVFALVSANRWKTGGKRYRTENAAHVSADGPVDAIDSWDDLSRGTDPTQ
ncbi:Trp biosynthesis-associated membrane protein [Microbacterium sp. CH12i]|uniref:Trp biosynthesis-associated membrane protein n=1 Tax=Microbacterium sp. CH12i TaxID=1479651 RepID=UPI000AC4B2F4|nr:Trp biosynthesis-associated membrane protein [Microbacterium sp. CH12i]